MTPVEPVDEPLILTQSLEPISEESPISTPIPEVTKVKIVQTLETPAKTVSPRITRKGFNSQVLNFPCSFENCEESIFRSFKLMDNHFRTEHPMDKYIEFRRGPYELIKMTQKCDDCGFHFPSEEEYFEHFEFCDIYKLDITVGRRKRRSVKPAVIE